MPFKMISKLEKDCGRLSGFAGALAPMVAGSLTERWRHKLPEGQLVIDLLQIQTFISEELEEIHQLLIDHENTHVAELAEDDESRETRDIAAAELREKLFQARHIFEGIFGPSASRKIFQEEAQVPEDPIPLYRLARRIQANLVNPDFPFPPLRLEAGTDLQAIARGFDDPLNRLGSALRRLNWGFPDSNASLAAKQEAMDQVGEEVGNFARFIETLYVIGGHTAIAQRVRRSTHVRNDDAAGEAQPQPSPEPSTDGPSQADLPAELTAPAVGDDEANLRGSAAA